MRRLILPISSSLDLLSHLLNQHPPKSTILLICSSKEAYLHQVTTSILTSQETAPDSDDNPNDNSTVHPLLTPTLSLLSASKHTNLLFCPTIPSLRAYLASHSPSTNASRLIVQDLVALHDGTSEFSAQGLSRTLAAAVEFAGSSQMDLSLVECEDVDDRGNPNRGRAVWDVRVPLLSGSVKLGGEGESWSNRRGGGVGVRRVVGRWFTFSQPEEKEMREKKGVECEEREQMLV